MYDMSEQQKQNVRRYFDILKKTEYRLRCMIIIFHEEWSTDKAIFSEFPVFDSHDCSFWKCTLKASTPFSRISRKFNAWNIDQVHEAITTLRDFIWEFGVNQWKKCCYTLARGVGWMTCFVLSIWHRFSLSATAFERRGRRLSFQEVDWVRKNDGRG